MFSAVKIFLQCNNRNYKLTDKKISELMLFIKIQEPEFSLRNRNTYFKYEGKIQLNLRKEKGDK